MKFDHSHIRAAAILLILVTLVACGGGNSGNGGGGGGGGSGPPPALKITTPSILPGTLTNHSYSVTLQATNGVGALTWSIAPISSTALFTDGLTIDPKTGVLSGNAAWSGTAGFIATVTDSASPPRSANQGFTVTATTPLAVAANQSFTVGQYSDNSPFNVVIQGGVWPITYTLTGGSLPLGLKLNNQSGLITGSAINAGTFYSTVTIQDSMSPPEVASTQLAVQVVSPPLNLANSLPTQLLLNRPFSGRVVATGGIPPYQFSLTSGSVPPGLSSLDSGTGQISGTPTTLGSYFISVTATDSSSPPKSASSNYSIQVSNPLGRNDSTATATSIGNGQLSASISPFVDPPASAPLPPDNDYYKIVSLSAAIVHVETQAQRWWPNDPLDTVIEIVDANGTQQTTCRQPGDTSNNFVSACVNDDIPSPSTTDSALDFKVPGPTNNPTTFYVHVLDWRGDARPDMQYSLQVSGVVTPLSITSTTLLPAARGITYSQQLTAANPIGAVTWSIPSGSLPPGLALNSSGSITGKATTDGTYSFTINAKDSGTPPQTASVPVTIQVLDPISITSPATWPDACVNQPYTFAIQTSGGLPPFSWSFISSYWIGISLDQSTGIFSGYSSITGTFTGTVGVMDATGYSVGQVVTLTVKQCP